MGQNRSTAVMQRRKVAPDSLDYFPTPPFATRALCEFLASIGVDLATSSAWEPACGELHMVRPLTEFFGHVRASDVHSYGAHELIDFTFAPDEPAADWLITNPPFNLAEEFIAKGLRVARAGVAILVRSAFLEGDKRHRTLFAHTPPAFVLQFVERVVMLRGRLVRANTVDPFATEPGRKASSATSYAWLIWMSGETDTRLRWLPESRDRLERPGDYPAYALPRPAAPIPLLSGQEDL